MPIKLQVFLEGYFRFMNTLEFWWVYLNVPTSSSLYEDARILLWDLFL